MIVACPLCFPQRILKSVLESPVDLLVGTPGTLLEFRERGRLFFSDVSYLVIDEADSMFDDTFKSETMKLLETISVSFNLDTSV